VHLIFKESTCPLAAFSDVFSDPVSRLRKIAALRAVAVR
jgi:hypothetical protein